MVDVYITLKVNVCMHKQTSLVGNVAGVKTLIISYVYM